MLVGPTRTKHQNRTHRTHFSVPLPTYYVHHRLTKVQKTTPKKKKKKLLGWFLSGASHD